MIKHTKVDKKNLKFLYSSPRGNIYFRRPEKTNTYEVCDGFGYEELYALLSSKRVELIFIEGPSLGTCVEVE